MYLPILTYPDKLLKKTSVPVAKVTTKITDFINSLFETMYTSETGIGLAAPQVGENINIFVMDVHIVDPDNPENKKPNPIAFINPIIIHSEDTIIYEEGCLSCPELLIDVERSKHIIVESLDKEGRPQSHKLSDLSAVCVQHEMDHLLGKLLTDKLSRLKREIYKKQRVRDRAAG
ncbi:MAG: peptide deformylase [Deltaproteobacteria bacterium]|nr:peptide deformylase [Deltaproteobacteria bacterium]